LFIQTPESAKFKLLQMHFHRRGSEYLFEGNEYAAELHLVHQSTVNPNNFAAVGFLFSVSSTLFF
jgi:carbonic anhydrase